MGMSVDIRIPRSIMIEADMSFELGK